MADTTKMPDLALFQWSRPDATNPRLASPLSDSGTTIYVTDPPLDEDGNIISKAFLMGIKTDGYVETIYVPANAVNGHGSAPTSANPGTTITGVTRGIDLAGLDYTTGNTDNAIAHTQDSPVFSNVAAFHMESMRGALQGNIASGGETWKIGNEADSDIKVIAENGDINPPFWMYDASANSWVYSNDGVSTTSFGTGAGVTGGDGIMVTAGDIDVDLSDATIFKAISAGAGDAGKSVVFDADGYIDSDSVQVLKDITASASELNKLDGTGATVSAANLDDLTDETTLTGLHFHKRTFGSSTKSVAATSDSLNITHGLGTTPKWVKIKATATPGYSNNPPIFSDGMYDGTTYATVYFGQLDTGAGDLDVSQGVNSSKVIYIPFVSDTNNDDRLVQATAMLTSTEIQLSFTNSDTAARSVYLTWECGV